MGGLFLVLEGMDGAGKSSQISLLSDYFHKQGRKVRTVHFPQVHVTPYGEMIAAYLRGEYGAIDSVHPRLAALLFALDRQQAAQDIRDFVKEDGILLADRYFISNIAYQRAKLANPADRDAITTWMENLEYGCNNIPRPDLTLFLDVPLSFSLAKLEGERGGKDREYLKGGKDIHEQQASFQEKVRAEYLEFAKKNVTKMGIVDCHDPAGGIADKATIHSRIINALRYYRII